MANSWAVEEVIKIADQLRAARNWVGDQEGALRTLAERLEGEEGGEWAFPVGTDKFPPAVWYAATWHDPSGRRNNGYGHTGIDLNLDQHPWGDVDRGQPVFAVAGGMVDAVGYSKNYLGGVVILVEHNEEPLYVRYWHLTDDALFRGLKAGQRVRVGQALGHIGDYRLGRGGDHLHLDMALDPFEPHWWFTRHPAVRWIDPVPVLMAHLGAELVGLMLGRGDG